MQNVYKFREKIANMQNALTEAKKCAKLAAKYPQFKLENFAKNHYQNNSVSITFKQFFALVSDIYAENAKIERDLAKYNDAPDPEQINWFLS